MGVPTYAQNGWRDAGCAVALITACRVAYGC
jgi:hypothetical protein